jgi:hypothetical protein
MVGSPGLSRTPRFLDWSTTAVLADLVFAPFHRFLTIFALFKYQAGLAWGARERITRSRVQSASSTNLASSYRGPLRLVGPSVCDGQGLELELAESFIKE